ncbi:hypothetical protein [Mucilaginibacter sp.]|uniref:dioxygenase family protein n=1 Tax=Mucilaginibacter sp. TaxID=1882438 RepID=UPI0025E13D55|nr:hypothetical protein [Mucilaginibacter sp.]
MNRSQFISLLGIPFFAGLFSSTKNNPVKDLLTDCDDPITPPVPEGPYYKNEKLNRANIVERKAGTPVKYIFMVEDKHCKPIKGAIVDIWQCDSEGHYSDFKAENTLNETWLRGYQVTDDKGKCEFTSIFPGWYTNRLTHLHAKVHINGETVLTTNLFFDKKVENTIHKQPLYPKGPNPTTITEDYELRVDKDTKRHDTLIMNITANKKGELTGYYKVSVA